MSTDNRKPFKRVDTPTGKSQYMDKEAPSRRVDAPTGKRQYMDKETSSERVDAPTGKWQYMDNTNSQNVSTQQIPDIQDKTSTMLTYTVTVKKLGRNKSKALDILYQYCPEMRNKGGEAPFTVTTGVGALKLGAQLMAVGAKVEVKKTLVIEMILASN